MSSTVLSDCEKDLSGTAFLWLPIVEASVAAITSTFLLIEIRLNFDSIAPHNMRDYRFFCPEFETKTHASFHTDIF